MNLIEEFTIKAALTPPLPVGDSPLGNRTYFAVTGGEISGERLNAKVLGGGDWALIGPDGFLRLDVRMQAETHDGAFLYLQYTGLLEMNEAFQAALANGTATDFEDQYFYANPRFETGDERYAWLNTTFFVGRGRALPGPGVEYRVYRPA
jgi:hypothetical protein